MSEITKTDAGDQPFAMPKWAWMLFAALTLTVYFSGLTVPLIGPDEARYAEVAREMWQNGDWLTPTLAGHPWFEKPPLLYWLEIASFDILGVGESAARLGPAICGLATIVTLWVLGRSAAMGERRPDNDLRPTAEFAACLAVVAASTISLIVFSHAAGFDVVVTFPLTAALACFYIFDPSAGSSKRRYLPLILFYVFVGIAILAKGLIGLIFPFAIIFLYHVLSRRWPARPFFGSLTWGLPLVLIIAAPWHLAMYHRFGSEFIDVYFVQNHFERFTTNRYLHPQPFYFFFWVLPVMTLPWLPFFVVAIWRSMRAIVQRTAAPLAVFAISWIAVPLVFFSLSGSKLPGYIVPTVPAAAIVTTLFLSQRVRTSRRWSTAVLAAAAVTLTIILALIVFALPGFAERNSVRSLIQAADAQGHGSDPVLTLHMISYNAEYYAAGRLLRNADGTQKRLEGAQLVLQEIEEHGAPVLVLVPIEYVSQLTDYDKVRTEVIKDNGETAIVAVSAK